MWCVTIFIDNFNKFVNNINKLQYTFIIINRTIVNLIPFAMIINFRYKDSLALLILILLAIIIDIIN